MNHIFLSLSFVFLLFNYSYGQDSKNRISLSREAAEYQLKEVLANNKLHNIINSKDKIIKNQETLISVIEPILFDIYGKENIEDQKPYRINDFENYYVVNGTLDKNHVGGTFLIIIDKRNAQILKMTHGK
ncbi:NTF2 fold immunity protein [Empedobacter sp. UBA7494]|uniref:NTF2 fold immunity protein n=1 Tax=Empedobacter sp. UBA7494 TaxID=1946450 RepID=UPI0025BF822E|nr:NTF2 fold immunity protein [Empedobacter sp. UBA7494]